MMTVMTIRPQTSMPHTNFLIDDDHVAHGVFNYLRSISMKLSTRRRIVAAAALIVGIESLVESGAVLANESYADSSSGLYRNGLVENGISLNGISLNKIAANGISLNKIVANGISLNKIVANGISPSGEARLEVVGIELPQP
jgi:hypothetical protein